MFFFLHKIAVNFYHWWMDDLKSTQSYYQNTPRPFSRLFVVLMRWFLLKFVTSLVNHNRNKKNKILSAISYPLYSRQSLNKISECLYKYFTLRMVYSVHIYTLSETYYITRKMRSYQWKCCCCCCLCIFIT